MDPLYIVCICLLAGFFFMCWLHMQTVAQVRFWKREAESLMGELMDFGNIGGKMNTKYHAIVFSCDQTEMRIGMKRIVTRNDHGDNQQNFAAMGRIVEKWHDHIHKSLSMMVVPEGEKHGS